VTAEKRNADLLLVLLAPRGRHGTDLSRPPMLASRVWAVALLRETRGNPRGAEGQAHQNGRGSDRL